MGPLSNLLSLLSKRKGQINDQLVQDLFLLVTTGSTESNPVVANGEDSDGSDAQASAE